MSQEEIWIPLLIKLPGKNENAIRNAAVQNIDIYPTLVEYLSDSLPGYYAALEGKSLVDPIINKIPHDKKERCWEHLGNMGIREGNWKLVKFRKQKWELYEMTSDRTELNNLIKSDPERANNMQVAYEAWEKRNKVLPIDDVHAIKRKYVKN